LDLNDRLEAGALKGAHTAMQLLGANCAADARVTRGFRGSFRKSILPQGETFAPAARSREENCLRSGILASKCAS
jgi:hypothetical protein